MLLKGTNFKQNHSCTESAVFPISSETTVAWSGLRPFYLKMQIEVLWVLLTTKTNLGKFTVARPFLAQALG